MNQPDTHHSSHSEDHHEIQHDLSEPNSKMIIIVVCVLFVALVALVIKGVFLYQGVISYEMNKKERQGDFTELRKIRLYETETLNTLSYLDKEKSVIQIPVDIAMESVVLSYRSVERGK